jgi:ribosome-associated protein
LAKAMVADGRVQVDGQAEGRKTCKIRAGQVVLVAGVRVRVRVLAGPRTG